jgi:hypothetical protein
MESLNISELENNLKNEIRINCPSCKENTLLKKQVTPAILPKIAKFAFLIGPAMMTIFSINIFILLKARFSNLPNEIKKEIQNNIFELPSRYNIQCMLCGYKFYENLRIRDIIYVFTTFWLIVILILFLVIYFK